MQVYQQMLWVELKYNKTAEAALQQIKAKDYAVAYASDPRPVFAVGLNFTPNNHTLDDWTVDQVK